MHRERRQSRTGAEHVADRWSGNVVCLLFFQAGLFPKNRAEPFFIHISMVVTRSSKAATPRCRNRFRMAHHAHPSSASFSRHGCSPRSGLHLCTVASYIFIYFFRCRQHFIQMFRCVIKAPKTDLWLIRRRVNWINKRLYFVLLNLTQHIIVNDHQAIRSISSERMHEFLYSRECVQSLDIQ